jgi:sugar O-acyltransferase (sialic acid O-acetyltransferase NeuD family)
MSRQQILIFGAGGHAKVVGEIARVRGLEVVGFIEDRSTRDGEPFFGARVIDWDHYLDDRTRWMHIPIALAIGDNHGRANAHSRLTAAGSQVLSLVHPSATVSGSAVVGAGTVIMAAAVINADAEIGRGVIVNTAAVVEHDSRVGDFAHLSPNVALGGGVRVRALAHVGLGAVILPRVEIGAGATVGAGAVVLHGVEPGITVVGVPARAVRASQRSRGPTLMTPPMAVASAG